MPILFAVLLKICYGILLWENKITKGNKLHAFKKWLLRILDNNRGNVHNFHSSL